MTLAKLADVLPPANREGRAVAGLVCLGWEDACAYAAAAEEVGQPVILQAGPGARAHMPLAVWGPMLRHLAERASVPVVVHLDHGKTLDECREALAAGFTSIMFDGSRLPFAENVARTREAVVLAREAGVSCEGEIGFVGYGGAEVKAEISAPTNADEAARFAAETGVDAMAVSVGNVHLQTESMAQIDYGTLRAIEAATGVPLVIHGASGISTDDRRRLASEHRVAKFNVGTELRQVFGHALRQGLAAHPERFDRIDILRETMVPLRAEAARIIGELAGLR